MSFGGDTFHNSLHNIDPALRGDVGIANSHPVAGGSHSDTRHSLDLPLDPSFRFGDFLADDDLSATYDAHGTGFHKDHYSANFDDEEQEEMFYGEDEEDYSQLGQDLGVSNIIDDSDEDAEGYIDDDLSDEENISSSANMFNQEIDSFHKGLHAAGGFRQPSKKGRGYGRGNGRRAVADLPYSHEVQILLGQANQAYVTGDHAEAQRLLTNIIQIDANVYPAWKVLGEVFAENGETEKCLLAWITAAHARPKDSELWVTCARMTMDQEFAAPGAKEKARDQAIYLYREALRANPQDWESTFELAHLYKDASDFYKAARMFEKLLENVLLHDKAIVKALAECYLGQGKNDEAIQMFETHIEFWKSQQNSGIEGAGLQWDHVNIFGDLFFTTRKWMDGIMQIRDLSRWLSGRGEDSFWHDIEDDREWDTHDKPRRTKVDQFKTCRNKIQAAYVLPLELRVKLGQFRLKLKHVDEGIKHLDHLLNADRQTNADLFLAAGDACVDINQFEKAILFWSGLVDVEEYNNVELWGRLGNAYKIIRQFENAQECYECIIVEKDDDINSRLNLVEIYEYLEKREEALELVNEIMALRRLANEAPNTTETTDFSGSILFPEEKRRVKSTQKYRPTMSDRLKAEKERTENCIANHRKLNSLYPDMLAGEPQAVRQWIDTAGEMVDDFRNSKALYPSERRYRYQGFIGFTTARRPWQKKNIEATIQKTKERLQANLDYQIARNEGNTPAGDPTQYRGLDFGTWLDIFLQYAICLTKYEDPQDAYNVCKSAKDANVFYHDRMHPNRDKRPTFLISAVHLACALYADDSDQVSEALRWFAFHRQFQNEAYSLFYIAASVVRRNMKDCEYPFFNSGPNQKYYMRHLKTLDRYYHGKMHVKGAANLNKDEDGKEILPNQDNIAIAMLYGHVMAAGKSYNSALNYYARAYSIVPTHPMILLSIGLAYLHRSMQRQANNRQLQILQAMYFMFEYRKYKIHGQEGAPQPTWLDEQEAEFNIGRAFQQIGASIIIPPLCIISAATLPFVENIKERSLGHYAIPYYNRCLELSDIHVDDDGYDADSDLKWETAYSLQLIYFTTGNTKLSKMVVEKYLVI